MKPPCYRAGENINQTPLLQGGGERNEPPCYKAGENEAPLATAYRTAENEERNPLATAYRTGENEAPVFSLRALLRDALIQ